MTTPLAVRRATYLFGVIIAIPILAMTMLGLSYMSIHEMVEKYRLCRILIDGFAVGAKGIGISDIAGTAGEIVVTAIFGLLIGAFGLWLPYHTLFGNHSSRWPR